jgi:hypothetical protein
MDEELKLKLGKLLIGLIPQIEKDLSELAPKERIEIWISLSAMYLHETAFSFIEDDDDDEEIIHTNEAYN